MTDKTSFGKRIAPEESLSKVMAKVSDDGGSPQKSADPIVPLTEKFSTRPPKWKTADLILGDKTTAEVEAAFARIEHHETLYTRWGISELEPQGQRLVVNLYGLPGTGKTMCAEAIASRLNRPILEVSYADIESKYVGETPKNIVAAFQKAHEAGAVLFFDEADSILGRRMTNVTQAADHSVNVSRAVMLKQLDDFVGVVVFATNLAKNFDGAFVRRILCHIEFTPPNDLARERLWNLMLPSKLPGRLDLDIQSLVLATDGMVGGDLKNVIINAATKAVTRVGVDQVVKMTDLHLAIEQVNRAKKEIGRYDYDNMTVTDTIVPI